MINFITPLLIIIGSAGFLALVLKKDFGRILPFYLLGLALFVYLFSLCGLMHLSFILLMIFPCLLPAYVIFRMIKKKEKLRQILKPLATPSMLIFLIIYALLVILNFSRGFTVWDEFMHWGVMVKETYRLQDFYNSSASLLQIHADYPPIITLYETAWCMFAGAYSEPILYIALQLLGLSFFLPFLTQLKIEKGRKFYWRFAGLILAMLLLPIIINPEGGRFYSTIYIDAIIGLLTAFGFSYISAEKDFKPLFYVGLALILSFLLMSKQICLIFVGLLVLYLIILEILRKVKWQKILISTLILVGTPLVLYLTWSHRVALSGFVGQFSISDIIDGIKGVITGANPLLDWQLTTVKNFAAAFAIEKPVLLGLTYLRMMILAPVAILLLGKFLRKYIKKSQAIAFAIIVDLGAALYALVMLLLYVFCFGEVEGPALASFARYMNTYWLAICVTIGTGLLQIYVSKSLTERVSLVLPLIVAAVLIVDPGTAYHVLPAKTTAAAVQPDAAKINALAEPGSKVYVVSQGTGGYPNIMLQYLVDPIRVNSPYAFSEPSALGPQDSAADVARPLSLAEWQSALSRYDYLYLHKINDVFVETYASILPEGFAAGDLYKITADSATLTFEKLEN